jgi:hypothetical protein
MRQWQRTKEKGWCLRGRDSGRWGHGDACSSSQGSCPDCYPWRNAGARHPGHIYRGSARGHRRGPSDHCHGGLWSGESPGPGQQWPSLWSWSATRSSAPDQKSARVRAEITRCFWRGLSHWEGPRRDQRQRRVYLVVNPRPLVNGVGVRHLTERTLSPSSLGLSEVAAMVNGPLPLGTRPRCCATTMSQHIIVEWCL